MGRGAWPLEWAAGRKQRDYLSNKNVLLPGQPRLGWLVDGNPDTERVAVLLQDTGSQIDLVIPTLGMMSADDPYGRWWSAGVRFEDDPGRERYSYDPPRVLMVEDVRGRVVLVGCRSMNSRMNMSVGEGHIVANYAVLGARHMNYERIHSMRTEVPAMSAWVGVHSMSLQREQGGDGRLTGVKVQVQIQDDVRLSAAFNLSMSSHWEVDKTPDGARIHEGVVLETAQDAVSGWEEQLTVHRSLLGLVSMASWTRVGISRMQVRRDDDGPNAPDGKHWPEWRDVVSYNFPRHETLSERLNFLYPFAEVGSAGIDRWLQLRMDYADAIDPILSVLWSNQAWDHAAVVQSGIALENLGYQIAVKKNGGAGLNSRGQMNFKPALRAILADMTAVPLDDPEQWIIDADACYMGAKHPDRPLPDSLTQVNTLRKSILVVRFWVGLQIGVSAGSLRDLLGRDPLADERVIVE